MSHDPIVHIALAEVQESQKQLLAQVKALADKFQALTDKLKNAPK